jgi:hypothetical protein
MQTEPEVLTHQMANPVGAITAIPWRFLLLPLVVESFQSLPNVLLSESGIASGRLNIDVAELFQLWRPIALPPR